MSCTGNSVDNPVNPLLPETEGITQSTIQYTQGRSLLGFYAVTIDRESLEIEAIPLRNTSWHLNALRFLEPAGSGSLVSFSALQVSGANVGVDITLLHPFMAMEQYCGFDVKGIVMGPGDYFDPVDPETRTWAGGQQGLRLLNADGWTRWWNPAEFPFNGTVFSFQDGHYGTTASPEVLDSRISGYKVFASALAPNHDLTHLLAYPFTHSNGRAVFHSSDIRTRHYDLAFPDDGTGGLELVFNYAIDASHGFPPGYIPGNDIEAPDDFPADANQLEPFVIDVQVPLNSIYLAQNGCVGGMLELHIRVTDWQALINNSSIASEVASIEVISPQLFVGKRYPELIQDGTPDMPWVTYRLLLEGLSPDSVIDQQLLVTIVSSEGSYQSDVTSYQGGEALSSYYVVPITVSQTPPVGQPEFELDPLSPWPRPGGNIHNTNSTSTLGPMNPGIAWEVASIDAETMPVVDGEGRIYAARYGDAGVSMVMFDSNGEEVADLFLGEFIPDGDPILVGCSVMWCSSEGEVIRIYQDGSNQLFYAPGMGSYSLGMLNVDNAGGGYAHGLASIQAFNHTGAFEWARYAMSDQCMFVGPTSVTSDGTIVVGKINIGSVPGGVFEFWGLDPDDGEVIWSHSPDSVEGAPFGCAADPYTGNIYYAISNQIVGFSIEDGISWNYKGDNLFLQNIAIAPDGTVYAVESTLGSSGGVSKLVSLSSQLDKKWVFESDDGITAGPITDQLGFVYFGANDGRVRCFGPGGSMIWERSVGGFPAYITFGPDNSLLVGISQTMEKVKLICLRD